MACLIKRQTLFRSKVIIKFVSKWTNSDAFNTKIYGLTIQAAVKTVKLQSVAP